jgi:hypothetical protein
LSLILSDPLHAQAFWKLEDQAKKEVKIISSRKKNTSVAKMESLVDEKLEEGLIALFLKIDTKKKMQKENTREEEAPIIILPPPTAPETHEMKNNPFKIQDDPDSETDTNFTTKVNERQIIDEETKENKEPAELDRQSLALTTEHQEQQIVLKSTTDLVLVYDGEAAETAVVINKIASRGAEHTKNKMPHKKNRHEKGIAQRNKQKAAAEKRLRKTGFAYTGKVKFAQQEEL